MRPDAAPLPVRCDNGPWPLHDCAASRALEQQALKDLPPGALMERAGFAVARLALALSPHARLVEIWAGPGNNGGDGWTAARHLKLAGKQVRVIELGDATSLPADARRAREEALAAGVRALSLNGALDDAQGEALAKADLLIDALLGIGSSRAPAGEILAAIRRINAHGAPVLAVDVPSGLNPDTGSVWGEVAVRAQATLSLLTLKPGCFTHQGRDHAGQVWLDKLDCPGGEATAWLTAAPKPARRVHASHKGSYGDVMVVGGAAGMTGAAWLAASAALAAGAGRVYCSLLDRDASAQPWTRPELMSRAEVWRQAPSLLAAAAVVCGCGGGSGVRQALPTLLAHAGRLVLDADALNAVASDSMLQTLLRQRCASGKPSLLTPHPLEAARLLACTAAEVQADRLQSAVKLALQTGATVLLKGSGTVIAAPGGGLFVNSSGNAALASAGTGDVLAGWAAGLWAQDMQRAAVDIAVDAAWRHGHAADRHTQSQPETPLRANALIEAMLAST